MLHPLESEQKHSDVHSLSIIGRIVQFSHAASFKTTHRQTIFTRSEILDRFGGCKAFAKCRKTTRDTGIERNLLHEYTPIYLNQVLVSQDRFLFSSHITNMEGKSFF